MIRRVVFSPEAATDLSELYDYIAAEASPRTALDYIDRVERHCRGFALFGERGMRREDIRPGLRATNFEGRLVIAITVSEDEVTILRLLYGGRDLGVLAV